MIGNQPLISVIVPAYNSERYIGEALQSVINQKYDPMEIIVVDDGSTDRTAEVVAGFGAKLQYMCQENGGPSAARNQGLKMAHGSLIAFLDADDLWSEQKVELQLKRFGDNPSVEIVLGNTQQIRLFESGQEIEFIPFSDPTPMLSVGGAMIRKSTFDKVGVFDETLLFCEDMDWFLRARELDASLIIHDDITQYYRKHTQNITLQHKQLSSYQLKTYKKSMDRRRNSGNNHSQILKKWSDYYETEK